MKQSLTDIFWPVCALVAAFAQTGRSRSSKSCDWILTVYAFWSRCTNSFVGDILYTQDQRFLPIHDDGSNVWILKLTNPQVKDSGEYECQVSYHEDVEKKLTMPISLSVLGKDVRRKNLLIKKGCDIQIVCLSNLSAILHPLISKSHRRRHFQMINHWNKVDQWPQLKFHFINIFDRIQYTYLWLDHQSITTNSSRSISVNGTSYSSPSIQNISGTLFRIGRTSSFINE